jgi:two-component system sensor histidine kinase GlrK
LRVAPLWFDSAITGTAPKQEERLRVSVKSFRPSSIIQLILIGFAVVALPLMVALIYAAASVDKLAAQSQRVISHAVKAKEDSRILLEQVPLMERNLRQYQVLGDEALLRVYEGNRTRFADTIASLGNLPLPDALQEVLAQLRAEEFRFYSSVHNQPAGLGRLDVAGTFARLADLAQQILLQSQRLIDAQVERTRASAQQARRNLFWLASALVPAVLILLGVVVVLIRRPLHRLDEAIRRLGAGDFSVPLNLEGPRDLEQLGERLDWMRTRLAEVEEDKRRFLRHISHELKTPLTSIREGSELLQEEIPGPLSVQQREIVELLHQNGRQLQKLIEDLLNYNAATHSLALNLEPVRLDGLINEVIADYKMAVMTRRLSFETELAELELVADVEKLRVVVDNLLSNAVKYSPLQGRIRVVLSRRDDRALLDVEDQGPGIPVELQERIFDPFYQGPASYTGHVAGSGLGLSIVREYLHAHGGTIEVANDDGRGAHLRATLPLRQEIRAG